MHSMDELENATFQGNEIDLVFVKDQNAYRFTFGFEFSWELINTQVTNRTDCSVSDISLLVRSSRMFNLVLSNLL